MKGGGLQLSISAERGAGAYIPFLRRNIRRAHRLIRGAPRELSVMIVTDATMARLHKQFLNIAGPTDVLTFEIERTGKGKVVSGEIVVCLGEARRQARERKIPASHELLLYVVHGMLHLSGFDDVTRAGYEKMHREEDRILTRLGIGQVFSAKFSTQD